MKAIQSSRKRNLYRFDPIAYLLSEKLQVSPPLFGLIALLGGTVVYLLTAWISGTLWSKPGQVGLLRDWLPWLWVLFINPVVLGYYLWSFQAIDTVIHDLEASGVFDVDNSKVTDINRIALGAYKAKWRIVLAIASASIFSTYNYVTRSELGGWTSSHPLPIAMITLFTAVVVYMGSLLVLNLIANIWIVHRILEQQLNQQDFNVNPLHPDRCGGLRSLSDYALKTAYLVAVFGIMVGFIRYQFVGQGTGQTIWTVDFLMIPLFIVLSVISFFGPLVAAHRGMKLAKEGLLREIAKQFQADYAQMHTRLAEDAETLRQGTEKIQELRAFYSLTNEFPVWPFDVPTLRRFLLTAPAPMLPLLINTLQRVLSLLLERWGIEVGW